MAVEPLVEFVHGEPSFARGVTEEVGRPFAVGVGGAEFGERVFGHPSQPRVSGVAETVHSQERDLSRARAIALDGLVLRTTVGSVVHGLSNPGTDDRDELGVCIEPPEYLLGFQRFEHFVYRTQPEGHPSGPGDLDLTIYGLRKFCGLALKGSPTTLLPLFVDGEHLLVCTPWGATARARPRSSRARRPRVPRLPDRTAARADGRAPRDPHPRALQAPRLRHQVRDARAADRLPGDRAASTGGSRCRCRAGAVRAAARAAARCRWRTCSPPRRRVRAARGARHAARRGPTSRRSTRSSSRLTGRHGRDHVAQGRHHHGQRGRRDRQRRELVAAGRRRRGRRDPPRGRARAGRGVPGAERLQDRRREAHGRVQAAGEARHPHGRAGVERRFQRRGRGARLLLPALDRARGGGG